MITSDIKDLYVNIPIYETLNILKIKLLENNNTQITYQKLSILKTILSQNCFTYLNKLYQPDKVLPWDPDIEHNSKSIPTVLRKTDIKQLIDTMNIALYTRYVDILIIYDTTKIQPHINTYINKIHDNIKLDPTYETHNYINYLYLTITRKQTNIKIDIYRKPTVTDTTINLHSNHPIELKMATLRFHISRMQSLPLNREKKQKNGT
jgi:hypothetical protein